MKYLPFLAVLAVACSFAVASPPQAEVANPVSEANLTTITLTPEAVTRLGIATLPAEKKTVRQTRLYGGEVVLPFAIGTGSRTMMALAPPQNAAELLKLAELQIVADGELSQALVRLDASKRALERAEKLLANQTGSERAVEEARSATELTKAAYDQALAKRDLLGPGLASVPDGKRWWVRAAILAADAATLDPAGETRITPLGGKSPIPAKRLSTAPPTASAAASTVDWYFEIEDPPRRLRPGERVEVRVPVASSGEERLCIPWPGVLHDVHGGQWVYEQSGATTFVRRRVQVARVAGNDAVLATGPEVGAKIVTSGATELFGIEFGPGK